VTRQHINAAARRSTAAKCHIEISVQQLDAAQHSTAEKITQQNIDTSVQQLDAAKVQQEITQQNIGISAQLA
jgi:hypothetical protein